MEWDLEEIKSKIISELGFCERSEFGTLEEAIELTFNKCKQMRGLL